VRVSETPGTGAGPTATPLPGPTATVVPTQQPGGATQAIESESMTISAPMRVDRDPSASGSQFVQTTGVSPASCTTTTSGGWAESTFSVPTTGAYRIWARTLAQTSASDSFCVQLDGGALVTWAPAIDPAWRWSTVTGLPATLDAGSHTLRFRYRETATKLDKLIVTADLAYVPTGFGVGGPLATATPAPTATPTPGAPSATPDAPTATPTGVPQTATPLPSTPTLIVSSPTPNPPTLTPTPAQPTATAPPTGNGALFIEAESGVIGAPLVIGGDPIASNGAFISVPKNAGVASSACALGGPGWARYTVTVSTAGNYTVWGRYLAPDMGSDSFCLQVDNGPMVIWAPGVSAVWAWGKPTPAVYALSAGTHTISVRYRETGTKLDRLHLTTSAQAPQ
jgi:hypothetical protein